MMACDVRKGLRPSGFVNDLAYRLTLKANMVAAAGI